MEEAKTSLIKSPLILLSPPLYVLKKRATAVYMLAEKFVPLQTAVLKLSYRLHLDKSLHTPDALMTRREAAYEAHTHSTHSQAEDTVNPTSISTSMSTSTGTKKTLYSKSSIAKGTGTRSALGRSAPDGVQCWIGSIVLIAATALLDR